MKSKSRSAATTSHTGDALDLKSYIRSIPDFPRPGILFRDITTLLNHPPAFRQAIDDLARHFKGQRIDKVVAVESRGFLTGAPLAYLLGTGLVPVRKKGKLPSRTSTVTYDLEYGVDTLEIHADAVQTGERVLVADDFLATGGTAAATCRLIEDSGGVIAGLAFLIELSGLKGKSKLQRYDVFSLLSY